jgi:hypothetical protein
MRIKLFESFENEDFIQVVKDCFQDLLDDSNADILDSGQFPDYDIVIDCYLPPNEVETNSFDRFFNQNKTYMDSLTQVKNCLDRLKQELNDEFDLEFESGENDDKTFYLVLLFKKGEPKIGEFYKVSADGRISIDKDDLRKVLNIPQSSEISRSSGSSGQRISIYFTTEEKLDEYKESVIDKMCKLKVGDEILVAEIDWEGWKDSKNISKFKIFKNQSRGNNRWSQKIHYIEFGINPNIKFTY